MWRGSIIPFLKSKRIYVIKNSTFTIFSSYLAPNYSYNAFIEAYKCKIEKGFSPYDYFDSYDKFNETELPSHDLFYSKMKNKNISDDEYNICNNLYPYLEG